MDNSSAKYGISVQMSGIHRSGFWISQRWAHPKHYGEMQSQEVIWGKFLELSAGESVRSIVLARAAIVEEILIADPILWHHGKFPPNQVWLGASLTVAAIAIVGGLWFR
jgi:hypothetical protein